MVSAHRADQRDHILDAALRLLSERGMAGLSMSSLAQEAGTSRATLYHYFPDIESVLVAWVGREVERSVRQLLAEAGGITDPWNRLAHLVRAQCGLFASQEHRLGAEHLESEAVSPAVRAEVSARMAPLRDLLARTLAEAAARGSARPGISPELAADLVLGMLGALRRHLVAGHLGTEEAAAAALGLLRQGWFPP